MPNDIANSTWSEVDASNTSPVPNGYPEGWNPSDVNNVGRQNAGGIKRFYDHINPTGTTTGSGTAYVLTYAVAPQQLWDRELYCFEIHANSGAAPTLNVNALGAKKLRKFSGSAYADVAAGELVAGQIITAFYNADGSGTYDIIAGVDVGNYIPQSLLTTRGQMIRRGASAAEALNVGAAGTFLGSDGTDPAWAVPLLSKITASLGANVPLSSTVSYATGPQVAQGASGIWYASGAVVLQDGGGNTNVYVKLWDGTNVVDSRAVSLSGGGIVSVSLSGYFTSPPGNICIAALPVSTTTGNMLFNASGNSKDCTLTAFRIG